MLAELVFVTRFLGLASGETDVVLRASDDVRRVEIRRDGKTLTTIAAPPFRTTVQLGSDLGPYELTAVGFDAAGSEVASQSRPVNVSVPEAEAVIDLAREGKTGTVRLRWWHVDGLAPVSAVLKLDGKIISRERTGAVPLGEITDAAIHIVSLDLRFPDGRQARREIAFGASEQVPVELTAIGVRQRGGAMPAAEACFRVPGKETAVAPVAVERGAATVLFILNGDPPMWLRDDKVKRRGVFNLNDVEIAVVSPSLQRRGDAVFFVSARVPRDLGVIGALKAFAPPGNSQFAQAIATTGMRLAGGDRRRAIVYVLGVNLKKDEGEIDPASVRRYLRNIGIPFHVWSLTGPRADEEALWGPVTDVSSATKLVQATTDLRNDLATQRIAWLAAPPLAAYGATASADCAYAPLTK